MTDPGFAILNDLVAVREHIDRGRLDLAKTALKRATWTYLDRWCDEAERDCSLDTEQSASDRTIGMADVTADTEPDAMSVSAPKLSQAPCCDLPLVGECLHHDCAIPEPEMRDEPPSHPV